MSLDGDTTLGAVLMALALFTVRAAVWLVSYKRPTDTERLEAVLRDLETATLRAEQTLGRIERDVIQLGSK